MLYVFDSSSFCVWNSYPPKRMPSLWKKLDKVTGEGHLISVREVLSELGRRSTKPHLANWIEENKEIFRAPSIDELKFVSEIFRVPHFQYLVSQKQRLSGSPVADPFVIASAKVNHCCVVTEEANRAGAAKIPNVCDHFKIKWVDFESFMENQGWEF